ncbi:MAG: glycosyltransferase [Bacteroidaceae bacterium]
MRTIVYIGGEFPDKDASALRILSNCKAIREIGYNVVVISPTMASDKIAVGKENYQGFDVYYYAYPQSIKQWFKELYTIEPFTKVIDKLDSVHGIICYNHHAVSLISLIRYYHRRNVKVYADTTEWHTTDHLPFIKRIIKDCNTRLRILYAQKKTDGIIVISKFFADLYKNQKNVIIVPPLIDTDEKKWIRNCYKSPVRTFSYTGRIGIGKDQLNYCIEAFHSICSQYEFRLNIIGCTKDEYLKQFPEDAIMIDDLGDKIFFKGYCSHLDALDVTKHSDFSFLIREHNRKTDSGFPTKLGESIACGTPVLATDFSNVKDYVEKYGIGIMIDKDKIEEAIVKIINMSDKELLELKKSCQSCKAFDYRNYTNTFMNFLNNN